MVNTRQNQPNHDSDDKLPGKSSSSRDCNHRTKNDDSDSRSGWERSMKARFPPSSYSNRDREHLRRNVRNSNLDFDEDLIDETDTDDGDDEAILTPPKRRFGRRSISRRLISEDEPQNVEMDVEENGVKEEDNDQDGVRRSKRQRNLKYDSFNDSWIFGTQAVLRGYPQMHHKRTPIEEQNGDTSENGQEGERTEKESKPTKFDTTEEDMYSKIKRTRRSRIRYSPTNSIPIKSRLRERRTRVTVNADSTESDIQSSSDEGTEVPKRRRRLTRPRINRDMSSGEENDKRVYHLRENKPTVERFQVRSEPTRRSSRLVLCSVRPRRYQRKRDSSSSDEERFERKKAKSLAKARSRCMPLNYKPSDSNQLQKTPVHSSSKAGATGPKGPADVDPMTIDTSVTFEKVGGLEGHLQCLKEMVVFPLMYREIFEKFKIQPPKGVLFHGPPGTGKTLIARALANECSQGDRKVSFFMRKGADCLSKWVGESERQLRLLFEQAHQMRPSIIFFDEIDGLAPVRSSKQDQIHASIVSTLLALLDGLDDRGEIIVIGATNRIDAIDPALRRPGRFDRELYFPLPGRQEREQIIKIHTQPWSAAPKQEVISDLAESAVGYCGSDLRMLCSEAVIQALRRRYPQIYKSNKKLLLQADQVVVEESDFKLAQTKIIPASCRVNASLCAKLSVVVKPLLEKQFKTALHNIRNMFPHGELVSRNQTTTKIVYKPRYLLCGADENYGQTFHVAPALLDSMEHIPVHQISLSALLEMSNRNPEEAIIQILREATRNPPSIVYLPSIDKWWPLIPSTSHAVFLERVKSISVSSPVLLLATSDCPYEELGVDIRSLFNQEDKLVIKKPTEEERLKFFERIIVNETLKEPEKPELKEDDLEELPIAPPPPPPPPSKRELEELHNKEEHKLRGLRIFLRDICGKLARNKQFYMFTKPVDINEVPDYLNIITQPMDLETMMSNIDLHRYMSAEEFLKDIDLIVRNALEYNPERDPEDKLIRHRACSLRDTAYTLIKAEMDTDFEEECRVISKKRRQPKDEVVKENIKEQTTNGDVTVSNEGTSKQLDNHSTSLPILPTTNTLQRSRLKVLLHRSSLKSNNTKNPRIKRKSTWARGLVKKIKRIPVKTVIQDKSLTTPLKEGQEVTVGEKLSDGIKESLETSQEEMDLSVNDSLLKTTPTNSDTTKKSRESPRLSSASKSDNSETPVTPKKHIKGRGKPKNLSESLVEEDFEEVTVDVSNLHELTKQFSKKTDGCTVETLLRLNSRLETILYKYKKIKNRRHIVKEYEELLDSLENSKKRKRDE